MTYCKTCEALTYRGICTNARCPDKQVKATKWIIGGEETIFRKEVCLQEGMMLKAKGSSIIVKQGAPDNGLYQLKGKNGTW